MERPGKSAAMQCRPIARENAKVLRASTSSGTSMKLPNILRRNHARVVDAPEPLRDPVAVPGPCANGEAEAVKIFGDAELAGEDRWCSHLHGRVRRRLLATLILGREISANASCRPTSSVDNIAV